MLKKFVRKKKVIIVVVVVCAVVLALVVLAGWKLYGFRYPTGASEYSAVYLRSGEVYVGRMDWFPWPRMKSPWILQRGQDGRFGLTPLASAFWSPMDLIYLNPKEIILWTYLKDGSEIVQALRNPSSVQAQPAVSPESMSENGSQSSAPSGNGSGEPR